MIFEARMLFDFFDKARTRNGIFDGDSHYDSHKYGTKRREVARRPHDVAYDAKRVRKKPAAR